MFARAAVGLAMCVASLCAGAPTSIGRAGPDPLASGLFQGREGPYGGLDLRLWLGLSDETCRPPPGSATPAGLSLGAGALSRLYAAAALATADAAPLACAASTSVADASVERGARAAHVETAAAEADLAPLAPRSPSGPGWLAYPLSPQVNVQIYSSPRR